jgi:Flp pilus assembly pilin Flp
MLFLQREDGQGLTEYALILVLVAFLLIVLLAVVGKEIVETYEWIKTQLAAL